MANTNGNGERAGNEDVTASELAAFAYCAKAWHLERVVGTRPSSIAERARQAGVYHHASHGNAVRAGSWLGQYLGVTVATLFVVAALLGFVALFIG